MNADANGEGFRIVRSDPALLLLELLWRWSFGLGLLAAGFFAWSHLRQVIFISDADREILGSADALAIATAIAGFFVEWQAVLLRTLAQIAAVAAVLWVAVAALGRGLLTRLIVRRLASDYGCAIAPAATRWTAFAILMIARVLMLLILAIGYLGGLPIAERVDPAGHNLVSGALIVLASFAVSGLLWSYVNWVLSLAPIFVVRDGLGPLDSIAAALGFIHRNYSHLAAIATWNATLRGMAATVLSLAGIATVYVRAPLPAWSTNALLALETLLYLVVSDYLLLARLAAYSSVAVRELILQAPLPGASQR